MLTLFPAKLDQIYDLEPIDSWEASKHRFDAESCWAVEAALAAGRPLLLRGEPGIGKSQLARAAAEVLQVPFLYHVVDERTERDDLLYRYDAVSRLAQAQLAAIAGPTEMTWEEYMAEGRFTLPGVLWWAFAWENAEKQLRDYFRKGLEAPVVPDGWTPTAKRVCGPVVLIDEIDKADPSVPNGLLESLGNHGFQTAQFDRAVALPEGAKAPLVIITTNEERELPAAFLRRCLVLHLRFPPPDQSLEEFLLGRARVYHSPDQISDALCQSVIASLERDRQQAKSAGLAKPGAAEFLDLVRILVQLHPSDDAKQEQTLEQVGDYALQKHLDEDL